MYVTYVTEVLFEEGWEAEPWPLVPSLDGRQAAQQFEWACGRWPDKSVRLTRLTRGSGGQGVREPRCPEPVSPCWREKHDRLVEKIERAFAGLVEDETRDALNALAVLDEE